MATLLLIIIFSAFIGLGIPDSLLGSAWPAICEELNIEISLAWTVTTPTGICVLLSSIFSAKVIEKFGTKNVTLFSTAITAIVLLLTSISKSHLTLILLAIPLGFGAGAIDSALNNYVALHYNATQMNFLHCFYGVGVACSPYIMSLALSLTTWRNGYKYASYIQFFIVAILIISSPLWKAHKKDNQPTQKQTPAQGNYASVFKNPLFAPICLIFFSACAIECTCGVWTTSYLVSVKGASKSDGALYLSIFYAGLTIGRFLSGILSGKVKLNKLNALGITLIFIAVLMLILPIKWLLLSLIALFLIGLGIAPIYPNMCFLTPKNFNDDNSQKAMGLQMAVSCVGMLLSTTLLGGLASIFGLEVFTVFNFIFATILAISYFSYIKKINTL